MLRRAPKTAHPDAEGEDRRATATILVVNDDEGACELLVRLLGRVGHTVQRAHSADHALGQLSVGGFDCVVLDLAAGGISQSLELVEAIRTSVTANVARVRIVLVAQQSSNRMFSWQAGIDAFVLRPFHGNELIAQVAEALARPDEERVHHRHREHAASAAAAAEARAPGAETWTPEPSDS